MYAKIILNLTSDVRIICTLITQNSIDFNRIHLVIHVLVSGYIAELVSLLGNVMMLLETRIGQEPP